MANDINHRIFRNIHPCICALINAMSSSPSYVMYRRYNPVELIFFAKFRNIYPSTWSKNITFNAFENSNSIYFFWYNCQIMKIPNFRRFRNVSRMISHSYIFKSFFFGFLNIFQNSTVSVRRCYSMTMRICYKFHYNSSFLIVSNLHLCDSKQKLLLSQDVV